MKPVVADEQPYYWIYIKTNIHLFITRYNYSVTDIKYSPNYTVFGLSLIHQVRYWHPKLYIYIYVYIYARGLIVIVVWNRLCDTSSNPWRGWWHFPLH